MSFGGAALGQQSFGGARPWSTTSGTPVATLISESRTKISRVTGFDSTTVTWSSSADFTSYQFRIVASPTDPVTAGVQVEQDQSPASGGTAATTYASTITDAEVEAVSPSEGAKILKLFVQNASGWSS